MTLLIAARSAHDAGDIESVTDTNAGSKLDGASVYELLAGEKATCTAGVPTVWLMLLKHMAQNDLKLPHLKFVVCRGSAMPRSMIKAFVDMGAEVRHAWGMTEVSPLGTVGALKPPSTHFTGEQKLDVLQLQGYAPFGVQMKITDEDGKELPWDGKTYDRLKVAGPAVSKAYYRVDTDPLDDASFFDTGDVATIDELGYMRITDRSKDVIKSGGEWISSIDLENLPSPTQPLPKRPSSACIMGRASASDRAA